MIRLRSKRIFVLCRGRGVESPIQEVNDVRQIVLEGSLELDDTRTQGTYVTA